MLEPYSKTSSSTSQHTPTWYLFYSNGDDVDEGDIDWVAYISTTCET
jgi:hypothetical protein